MTDLSRTSKSFASKTKRGLSLSIQKKKPKSNHQNGQDSFISKETLSKQPPHANLDQSIRKNKIKFVQSYQKNQSGDKYSKGKIFKNTDQDLKLGGNKQSSLHSRKTVLIPQRNLFSNCQFNIATDLNMEQNHNNQNKVVFGSEKKLPRESKVSMNLNSNINYFQSIKIQSDKMLPLTNYGRYSLEEKYKDIHEINNISVYRPGGCLQTVNEMTYSSQENSRKQSSIKQEQISEHKDMKQSIQIDAMQKLKKVQANIDQLLTKVSQTRAYLLR